MRHPSCVKDLDYCGLQLPGSHSDADPVQIVKVDVPIARLAPAVVATLVAVQMQAEALHAVVVAAAPRTPEDHAPVWAPLRRLLEQA